MFCEKCGAQVEPGELFCGNCGARIENSAPAPAYTPAYKPAYTPSIKKSGAGLAGLSASGMDLKMVVTGVVMLIASFLPMISINLGKLGELAQEYLGDLMPEYLNKLKINIYKIVGLIDDYSYLGIPGWVKAVAILAVVFLLATVGVSIAAGVLRKKSLMIASGVMCGICFLVCVAYMIYMAVMIGRLNKEIMAEMGEFGAVLGNTVKIRSINGFGLYLFLIGSGLQTYFSISGANKAA